MNIALKFFATSLLLSIGTFALAQTASIKDKFRANENGNTIVVIKDEKASDQDILNQQFDLSNFSMDDQVKITRAIVNVPNVKAETKERNNVQYKTISFHKVYGEVPPPRASKIKHKRKKVKRKRARKKYRGACYAF
ncbi:MAG: hypothetical protein AAGK97_02475 [Bacteroidota bacterium]